MYRTIIFDIDETLYSYNACHSAAMPLLEDYLTGRFGWKEDEIRLLWKQIYQEQRELLGYHNAAIHETILRIQMMLEKKGINPLPHAGKLHHLYWDTFIENMKAEPGVEDLIDAAGKMGIRLGIATDMTADIQYRKLEKLGLLTRFDFIVTSEEAGYEKPHEQFFSRVVRKAGCAPSECLMIGDNWEKDIEGARNIGMDAAWYQPGAVLSELPETRRRYCFGSYRDLAEKLQIAQSL